MLTDYWYIACAASEVDGELLARRILGTDLVLLRGSDGAPRAFLDRCCHRGFPLSASRRLDGVVQCGYHGWKYDDAGRCVHIPSLAQGRRIPEGLCLQAFPVAERDGFLWVWMGKGEPVSLEGVRDFQAGRWFRGVAEIGCNYLRALEITFDDSHVYFVHPTHPSTAALKRGGFREADWELRGTDTGCVAFYPVTPDPFDSYDGASFQMEFRVPNEIYISSRLTDGRTYRIFTHTVPVDKSRCRLHWLSSRFDDGDHVTFTEHAGIARVLEEDRRVLERIEAVHDQYGSEFERSVESDAASLMVRKIARAVEEGRWPGARRAHRRVVHTLGVGAPQHEGVRPRKLVEGPCTLADNRGAESNLVVKEARADG